MATLPIGAILFFGLLFLSSPMSSWGSYLNAHSIIIVLGGTIAIFAMATPSAILKSIMRDLRALGRGAPEVNDHASEFEQLAETRRISSPSENSLINYAVELWDNGTSPEILQILISQRKEKIDSTSHEAVQALRNLAKYPPALGMIGTVMGLVTLFINLSADNRAGLGPSLGLALTSTFFGLIVANGVIMPLADRLHVSALRQRAYLQSVYELLLLINRREPATLIRGEVKERAAEAA